MQQAVQASQIHEYAEIGNVFDNALAKLADLNFRQDFFFTAPAFLFDQLAPRYDDVSSFDVDLEDHAFYLFADKPAYIARLPDIDLRSRQENRHTNIYKQTTLDSSYNFAGDNVTFLLLLQNLRPAPDQIGFALVQLDQAALGVGVFQ